MFLVKPKQEYKQNKTPFCLNKSAFWKNETAFGFTQTPFWLLADFYSNRANGELWFWK